MPFIVYTTMWSEGSVVAHTDDKAFAIGTDGILGHVVYVSKEKLYSEPSFRLMVEFEDEMFVKKFDTALYPRKIK